MGRSLTEGVFINFARCLPISSALRFGLMDLVRTMGPRERSSRSFESPALISTCWPTCYCSSPRDIQLPRQFMGQTAHAALNVLTIPSQLLILGAQLSVGLEVIGYIANRNLSFFSDIFESCYFWILLGSKKQVFSLTSAEHIATKSIELKGNVTKH